MVSRTKKKERLLFRVLKSVEKDFQANSISDEVATRERKPFIFSGNGNPGKRRKTIILVQLCCACGARASEREKLITVSKSDAPLSIRRPAPGGSF